MWSNRETSELYEHLSVPANTFVEKIVSDAIDNMNSRPELWSDYERQAIRVLATNLRAHVEGMFEDFYFGPPETRTHALALIVLGSRLPVAGQLDGDCRADVRGSGVRTRTA